MATVTELKSKGDYSKNILLSEGVTVLDGYATWCGPCKQLAPEYAKMATELSKASFFTFNVEEVPDIAQELGVNSMPTIMVFKDGDLMDKIAGNQPAKIRKAVEQALG